TLALTKADSLGCERVRPLAWCSRPRDSETSPAGALMLAPLYTAAEMRAAEQGHDVEAMMELAGSAVAAAVLRRYPDARRIAPGRFHAGAVEIAEIGLDPAETQHRLVTEQILQLVPRKQPHDTKYSAGMVLVVGGAPGLTGAVCLAAEAAFRADAGYVAVATPAASLPVVEARLLEAVKAPLQRVDELAERAGALAIGPGLGRGDA